MLGSHWMGKKGPSLTLNKFLFLVQRTAGVTVEEQSERSGSLTKQLLWPVGMNSSAGHSQPGLRFLC